MKTSKIWVPLHFLALIALALSSVAIQEASAQLPVTLFTNNFNALSGAAPGYSYGDVANVTRTYASGVGVDGSVGVRITGDFVPPGKGFGGVAYQYQNGAVTGNTNADLSNYVLSFDAKANRKGGGLQIILQTWSGTGFSGTGPLTSSSLADVILGDSNVVTHCSVNLGTQLRPGASATAHTWQVAFVMDEAYFGGPGVSNQLIIDNLAVTMGGPTWKPTDSLHSARDYQNSMTLLTNGTVLIEGGLNGGTLVTAEVYDPVTGQWTLTGPLHHARDYHTSTLLSSGRVLAAGGYNSPFAVGDTEVYDPIATAWSDTGALNTPRFSHTATLLPNGQVLVAGGVGGGSFLNSAELYDPARGQWTYTGSMTTNRVFHTATLLLNGKVLVTGGQYNAELTHAELYDPVAGKWTATGPMHEARENHTATLLLDGKVLVAGGGLSSAELYDPVNGTWSMTGAMGTRRAYHTATLLPNGKVLVAGGGPTAFNLAELYDPADGKWTPTVPLNTGRWYHSAVLLNTGKVLVAAGADFSYAPLASAELYDPAILTGLPPTIGNLQLSSTGVFQFVFTNAQGASFNAFFSTNPALPYNRWAGAGSITEISPGQYEFNDPKATNNPQGFYRVVSP